jgi:hypothetical protein
MKILGRKTVKTEKTSAPKASKARTSRTSSKATGAVASTAAKHTPTHDEIAARSYELFLARGSEHGHAEEDWLRAEAELSA